MGTIIMVFGSIFVISAITFLSRQNIRRFVRQRKTSEVLTLVRQVSER